MKKELKLCLLYETQGYYRGMINFWHVTMVTWFFCLSLADCCLNRSCVCSKYALNASQMAWHRFTNCLPHGWAKVDHGRDVLQQRGIASVVVTTLLLWMQPSIHTLVVLSAGENSCICYCKLDIISSIFVLFLWFLFIHFTFLCCKYIWFVLPSMLTSEKLQLFAHPLISEI